MPYFTCSFLFLLRVEYNRNNSNHIKIESNEWRRSFYNIILTDVYTSAENASVIERKREKESKDAIELSFKRRERERENKNKDINKFLKKKCFFLLFTKQNKEKRKF